LELCGQVVDIIFNLTPLLVGHVVETFGRGE